MPRARLVAVICMVMAEGTESLSQKSTMNLLSDSLWTNRWNAENRLVQVESTTAIVANKRMREVWTHLPDGRWIERIVSTNNGSAYYPAFTNRFIWDGQVLMAILDHTNGLVMSFVRGLDLSGSIQGAGGVGGVLAVNFKTNGTHFVSYDGNGNVVALSDSTTGTSSGQFEYGPFSEPIRVTGTAAQMMPLRFSTMYEDSVTGDRKYLFRDLNPSTGRWKSRDPIQEESTRSLYMFVNNGPTQFQDSKGLSIFTVNLYYEDRPSIFEFVTDRKKVKREVFRVLQDCVQRMAKPCNRDVVFLNWFAWDRQRPKPPLGFTRAGFRKVSYTAIGYRNDRQNYAGYTNGDEFWLNSTLIREQAVVTSNSQELTLGAFIAHELLHHALAGDWGHHWHPTGYIDAVTAEVGSRLSDECCKEIVDEMDID